MRLPFVRIDEGSFLAVLVRRRLDVGRRIPGRDANAALAHPGPSRTSHLQGPSEPVE